MMDSLICLFRMIKLPTASSGAEPNLDRQRKVISLWLNLDWEHGVSIPLDHSKRQEHVPIRSAKTIKITMDTSRQTVHSA